MADDMRLTKAQQAVHVVILRDVLRSGGKDRWSHLHSHGHNYGRVIACVNRGYLRSPTAYHFELTDKGRALLDAPKEEGMGETHGR